VVASGGPGIELNASPYRVVVAHAGHAPYYRHRRVADALDGVALSSPLRLGTGTVP